MATIYPWTDNMPPKDKQFYQQLGQRIAERRRAQELTQRQLADILGISQQTMAHYEGGHLRISVELLIELAKVVGVPVQELIGEQTAAKNKKRGPTSALHRQIEQIQLMPRNKQKFITDMLEALIKQQQSA